MTLRSSTTTWRMNSARRENTLPLAGSLRPRPSDPRSDRASVSVMPSSLFCRAAGSLAGGRRASQGRRDLNPQPPVLETGALPIELRPSGAARGWHRLRVGGQAHADLLQRRESTVRPRGGSNPVPPERDCPCAGARPGCKDGPMTDARISRRIAAITESATLAVDAKAKALKAAGRPVIGFGAGEPDFPTPGYIVEAAIAACADPRWHRYTPAGGLPELKEAIAAKTLRDSGLRGLGGAGARHQRRQAGPLQRVRHPARPGRRGHPARALLDDLPGVDPAGRRRPGRGDDRRDLRLPGHRRAARGRPHRPHQGARVRVAVQPDRRGLLPRRGQGHRRVGRSSTASGSSPTRSTSTSSTATPSSPRCRCWCPSSPTAASSSTASPRRTP